MKTFKLNKKNVNNIESEICFLSAGNTYDIGPAPFVKQVIIFVPYNEQSNLFKANAKRISLAFQGASVIIVDTKETVKAARACNLRYNEVSSTLMMAISYLLARDYDQVEIEDLECYPREIHQLKNLESQTKVKLTNAESKNVLPVN